VVRKWGRHDAAKARIILDESRFNGVHARTHCVHVLLLPHAETAISKSAEKNKIKLIDYVY
jgi:hypothetical protein